MSEFVDGDLDVNDQKMFKLLGLDVLDEKKRKVNVDDIPLPAVSTRPSLSSFRYALHPGAIKWAVSADDVAFWLCVSLLCVAIVSCRATCCRRSRTASPRSTVTTSTTPARPGCRSPSSPPRCVAPVCE
jgi:hypothetical protein